MLQTYVSGTLTLDKVKTAWKYVRMWTVSALLKIK